LPTSATPSSRHPVPRRVRAVLRELDRGAGRPVRAQARGACDGKRIGGSFAHAWDRSTAMHLVSAFVAENRTVLGPLAVDRKENEIVVIPKLLALPDLTGARR
jgi:hypothetical protein